MLLLRPEDVRGIIPMAECVAAAEEALRDWGRDPAANGPRQRTSLPTGVRVSIHRGGTATARASGALTHCERVAPQVAQQDFDYVAEPVSVLYDGVTGELDCVIVGEVTCAELPGVRPVSGVRTAATAAVGTRLLTAETIEACGVFGGGNQAWLHLMALTRVRRVRRIVAYRRDARALADFCREASRSLQVETVPATSPRQLVSQSDVVVCATNASVPVFDGAWLRPGQHVTTLVGGSAGGRRRRETDDEAARRAEVILATSREQAVRDEQGALFEPAQAGVITWEQVHDVADALLGRAPVRTSPRQITLFVNNAGQGIVDVAIGRRVCDIARRRGVGVEIAAPGVRGADYRGLRHGDGPETTR